MDDLGVDAETVRHVADLAYVELEGDDVDRYTEQFAEILAWFDTLEAVPEVVADEEVTNVLRPDEVRPSLDRDRALSNAGETEDGYFRGPPVG